MSHVSRELRHDVFCYFGSSSTAKHVGIRGIDISHALQ